MNIPNITLDNFNITSAIIWFKPEKYEVQVGISFEVPSTATGTPVCINFDRRYPIELLSDPKAMVAAAKEVALEFFKHELDEKLQLDGIVVNPPHVSKNAFVA